MSFPKQSDIELPLLQVIVDLGGSARPRDVYSKVAAYFPQLTPEEQEERLENYPSTRKWSNLVQWARQKLVDAKEIDNATRGVWAVTDAGRARLAKSSGARGKGASQPNLRETTLRDLAHRNRDEAKRRILAELKRLSPTAFERFCTELLQQLGFRSVEVTRRSKDGGIDGYGDFRQGAVSIKSAFQAKRWDDTPVRRPDVDKLRGAIQGEYDHECSSRRVASQGMPSRLPTRRGRSRYFFWTGRQSRRSCWIVG